MDVRLPTGAGTRRRSAGNLPARAGATGLRRGGRRSSPSRRRTRPVPPGRPSVDLAAAPLAAPRTRTARTQRASLRSVATPREAEIERQVPALRPVRLQEPFDGRDRGLGRPAGRFHIRTSAPRRAQDAANLGECSLVGEPVEGLCSEDGVDRGVRERNLLGGPGERLGAGTARDQQTSHLVVWLDADYAEERGDEQPRELARASAKVEHRRRRRHARDADRFGWVARPATLVGLVPAAGPARVDVGHGEMGGDGIEHTCSMRCGTRAGIGLRQRRTLGQRDRLGRRLQAATASSPSGSGTR